MTTLNLRLCDNPKCKTRSENLSPEAHTLVDRTAQALLKTDVTTPGFLQELLRVLSQQCGTTTRAPRNAGRRVRWQPGIIRPPYVPDDLLQEQRYWYCSDACYGVTQPTRDEHERLVRDRYDEKPHVPALTSEDLRRAEFRLVAVERLAPHLSVRQKETLAIQLMDKPDTEVDVAIYECLAPIEGQP